MGATDITDVISTIDWDKPDTVNGDGTRVFSVRCRMPFTVPTVSGSERITQVSQDARAVSLDDVAQELGVSLRGLSDIGHNGDGGQPERVLPDDGDGIILPDTATGDTGSDDEVTFSDTLVSGIASSTSVDFYGTEMSMRALKLMAVQMIRDGGIVYLPRHNHGMGGAVEWDEVIGRTIHAEVVPAESVARAYNEAEGQFILRVTIQLYEDEPLAQALVRRIQRGEGIGQSIGGWFTHLQVIQSEDGEVERVIVQGVELDHLAVTRAPANPDSMGIVSLRSIIQDSAREHRVRTLTERVHEGQTVCATRSIVTQVQSQMDERHVVSVTDNGDGTASIRLVIHHMDEDTEERTMDDEDDRMMEDDEDRAGHEDDEDRGTGPKKKRAIRMVTNFADLPLADVDTMWSWDTAAANAVLGDPDSPNWERFARAHIWVDPENMETREGYKLPIARMFDGTLRVVFRGVVAAMAAVNGARGGVDIPEGERRDAYDHLTRYYEKFDRDPPEYMASLPGTLDTRTETRNDASDDARRSAVQELSTLVPDTTGSPPEERTMNEQELSAIQQVLRDAVSEATAPLIERVTALESATETPEPVNPPNQDDLIAQERTAREAAEERARVAEAALAEANRRPMRVGRSVVPSIPQGPAAHTVANSLIERTRAGHPTVAAIAERSVDTITDSDQPGTTVTRRDLEGVLRSLLTAAEADGIITDPNHRAVWQ